MKWNAVDATASTSIPKKQVASSRCSKILAEVEDILVKLNKKHGSQYTVEQLNCWAIYLER